MKLTATEKKERMTFFQKFPLTKFHCIEIRQS